MRNYAAFFDRVVVETNCNSLKEESAGKTAEVAFFYYIESSWKLPASALASNIFALALSTLPSRQ